MLGDTKVWFSPLPGEDTDEMRQYFEEDGFNDYTNLEIFDDGLKIVFKTPERAKEFIDFYDGKDLKGYAITATLGKPQHSNIPSRRSRDSMSLSRDYRDPRSDYRDGPDRRDYDDRNYREPRGMRDSFRDSHSPRYSRDSDYYDRRPSDNYRSSDRSRKTKTVVVSGTPLTLTERDVFDAFARIQCFVRQVEKRGSVIYVQFDTIDDADKGIRKLHGDVISGCRIYIEFVEDKPLNLPVLKIPLVIMEDKSDKKI